ncbi:MAG: tRNA threonylcarbamoyladenosine dehydratase [Firmicutes bacterium]|nr:tRNA threonylcarbamoyladenosine dehydratase [Bacillota bacterium]
MLHRFSRLELLIGAKGLQCLQTAHVAIFGIGGVGSFAAEALARSGIGRLRLVDHDVVSLTNINRQLPALESTIGRSKVQVMAERIKQINPDCHVEAVPAFLDENNWRELLDADFDYVVDAIDTVASKLILIEKCRELNQPIICSMGAGNKFDPSLLQVADISKTSIDPLAKVMRRELRKRGIYKGVKVVFSTESPAPPLTEFHQQLQEQEQTAKRQIPGSTAFVPPAAGLLLASAVVRDLLAGGGSGK